MNILLVHPHQGEKIGTRMIPPLWPSILAALTPEEHHVEFVYGAFEKITARKLENRDLVAISVPTAAALEAYRIGELCKSLNVRCVMGGIHAYVLPMEAKAHCDAVLLGEAEYVWHEILAGAMRYSSGKGDDNNGLKPFYKGTLAEPVDFPQPDMRIYDKYWFYTTNMVETVRGCPYDCEFCGATMYSGRKYRYKPIENILAEISSWKRKDKAFFVNTNLTASFSMTKKLLRAIRDEFNLRWWSACTVDIARDDELIKLMAESGCSHLQFGFESISAKTLRSMNKPQNIRVDYRELVRKLHDYNIDVVASFVLGWDTDTPEVFERTLNFALAIDIDVPAYFPLIPFPGTKIYKSLRKERRILTYDWSKYNGAYIVYQPKNMSIEELRRGISYCWEESFSCRSIMKRVFSRNRGLKKTLLSIPIWLVCRRGAKLLKPYWETGSK
jgi:radical SAM superfamily enzyme YgiQ (UPF0313 family)